MVVKSSCGMSKREQANVAPSSSNDPLSKIVTQLVPNPKPYSYTFLGLDSK